VERLGGRMLSSEIEAMRRFEIVKEFILPGMFRYLLVKHYLFPGTR
jgi:hypothetical protein